MPNTETAGAGAKPERTPQDYAIEHAEYLAQDAERLLDAINHLNAQRDEDGDAFDSDALARAEEAVTEAFGSVRNGIYEFRKRRDRATAQPAGAQQPGAAYAAPQFPDHPEPMVMDWSAIEISVIAQYGRDMYEAGKRASHGQAPAQDANEYLDLLAQCRSAFPIPERGDPLEVHWAAAMADPGEVPGYLQEIAARHAAQADPADIIAGALQISRGHAYDLMRGAVEQAAPAAVAGPSDPSITLDFKMASELLDMFGGEPGLVTLQHGGEKCHSGAGLYAWHSDLPEEGAEFLGAEPHDEATPTTQPVPQREPAEIDTATMALAESVGLIGPASRTHDLHGAIQRFHDLICANATIKAAQMAAEAISAAAPQPSPAAQGDSSRQVLQIVADYADWLDSRDRLTSFSAFVNEFGYQGRDCKSVYEMVVVPCLAARAAQEGKSNG